MLELQSVVKNYGPRKALSGLTLTVLAGETFALLGPNGAGKTTAIRVCTGLSAMTSGSVRVAGVDIARAPAEAKRLCGLAGQNTNLDGELTVTENLDFHGRLHGMARADRRRRTAELLEYVEMADRAAAPAKTLSGGLKRRLMLARAMLHRPRLLFLDEPTVGLDPGIRRKIWSLIARVRRDGVTVFLTTHYIEEAEFIAGRVGFVNAGQLVAAGPPAEMTSGLGEWAVDSRDGAEWRSAYFPDPEAAGRWMAARDGEMSLRRVNLEDAFLALTGKRIE